jgi:nucleotide-binding universal stress UspA family protein
MKAALPTRGPARDAAALACSVAAVALVTGAVFVCKLFAPVLSLGVLYDGVQRRQGKLLREAKTLLGEWDVRMAAVTAIGDPTAEIRSAAEESGASIIVVGRGSGLRRLLSGSVSTRLVRQAPCDVLVVH